MPEAFDEPHKSRHVLARLGIVRLLIFFFALALADYGLQVVVQQQLLPRVSAGEHLPVAIAATIPICIFLISIYALLVGWLERRDIRELELGRGMPQLIAGLLLSFLMFCAIYAVLWKLHVAAWFGIVGFAGVLSFIPMALLSGVGEELIFRGGIFRILEDMFGTGVALVVSGAVFGALHLQNLHATWFSSLAIALEAGVLLGAAYAYTRNLWLPIGIHIGWNFTEGAVFGAPVSGNGGGNGIVVMPLQGPDLLTGGPFGPEASVVALVICTTLGLFFVAQTIRKGHWVRASFHMLLD